MMGRLGILTLALLAAHAAQAQDTRQVREPVLPPACTVLQAAAAPDDTARIQQAIDACPAGQGVRLSGSKDLNQYHAGPLVIKSGVTLLIDGDVTLFASRDPRQYDKGTGACGKVQRKGRQCKPFITIADAEGSGIMGDGVIDGQGGEVVSGGQESWWQMARRAQKENLEHNVPRLVEISNARNITLYRTTFRNSPNFHVTVNRTDGFTAWGVTLDTPASARNTDGIDPSGSKNITIAYSTLRTGDDNVAIKGGSNGPTTDVSILHNRFYDGHGMSIGSETNGGVARVLVQDLLLDGTSSGLRIKSDVSRGGLVRDVRYQDVCMRNVAAPIDLATRYNPQARGDLIPQYVGIRFERVHALTPGKVLMQGADAAHPLQLTLQDVSVAGTPEQDIVHANVSGSIGSSDQGACAGRFTAAPRSLRPQLSVGAGKKIAPAEVLKYVGTAGAERVDPWDPLADPLASGARFTPDMVVDTSAAADGKTRFHSVQQAVDAIVRSGLTRRVYLLVKPGVYRELVYVPRAAPPITMYGEDPQRTRIVAALDAAVSGEEYARRHGAQFKDLDARIMAMHQSVRERASIGTFGSMTVWVQSDGFQARDISFENAYNKDTGNARADCTPQTCGDQGIYGQMNRVHHQALALQVDGADKAQFEHIRLIGYQDTLYLKAPRPGTTTRSFFNRSYVEGDVDFIFGDSTAYFHQCEIRSLGDREVSYVAAPSTHLRTPYGFVFDACRFTSDERGYSLAGKFFLARQWFHNQKCSPYAPVGVPGYSCTLGEVNVWNAPKGTVNRTTLETVGKVMVVNSVIGRHIQRSAPWSDWNKAGTLAYRPAQFNSDDYFANLRAAGIDPLKDLGYAGQPVPAQPFLVEFNNANE
ncbi:pectinesterase family protein [Massilia sp. TS11]|uniref:pectinesterase family protein n=1 Tax=Massilia sp. TS11 TaxID=2908003 RepID=UPI001EDA2AD8|nr:pectinesterase family protein [Massilia sp. TS11]MCG2583765.1 pectinesterase family protein [Massilia sp. TS11]